MSDYSKMLEASRHAVIEAAEVCRHVQRTSDSVRSVLKDDSSPVTVADYAAQANARSENIGARRLHTVLEALLEEVSFSAPDMSEDRLRIDAAMVRSTLQPILSDDDLAKYIL